MKLVNSLYYSSISVYLLGLVLKFFRTPFHTVIILLALLGMICAAISYYILKDKEMSLLTVISIALGSSLLALLKFWPNIIVLSLLFIGIIISALLFGRRSFSIGKFSFAGFLLVMIFVFGAMTKSTRYYWVGLHYNIHADTDALTWSKYAWMLNLDHKYDQASLALKRAASIANKSSEDNMLEMLEYQTTLLSSRQWTKFR